MMMKKESEEKKKSILGFEGLVPSVDAGIVVIV